MEIQEKREPKPVIPTTRDPKENLLEIDSTQLLDEITNLQRDDGSWLLNENLSKVLCISLKTIKDVLKDGAENETVWATSLVITFIEVGLPLNASKVVSKARTFLSKIHNHAEWLSRANKFILANLEITSG